MARKTPIYGTPDSPNERAAFPKSFEHWCNAEGIHFKTEYGVGYSKNKRFMDGVEGRYREFRALPRIGVMQICDGYFDRWANSVGAEVPMPRTKSEFVAAVRRLVETAKMHEVPAAVIVERLEQDIAELDADIGLLSAERLDWDRALPFSRWDRPHRVLRSRKMRRIAREIEVLRTRRRWKAGEIKRLRAVSA